MSAPSPYSRQYSFTSFATEFPTTPPPGQELDIEFNAVLAALNGTQASLAQIQRTDGALANGSVGPLQLSTQLSAGFNAPTVWVTATAYVSSPASTVLHGSAMYVCLVSHTSGVFSTDLAAGKWQQIFDLSAITLVAASQIGVVSDGGNITSDVQTSLNALDTNKSPINHTHLSTAISDSTAAGRALLTAASVTAQMNILSAVTSPITWSGGGRQTFQYPTPVYDQNSGAWSSYMDFTSTGYTIPSSSTFSYLRMGGTSAAAVTLQATVGAGAIFSGIEVWLESLVGSDPTSNTYPAVLYSKNSGPGISKALHAYADSGSGCTGTTITIAAEISPVVGQANSWAYQASMVGATIDGVGIGLQINSNGPGGAGMGTQYLYGIGTDIQAVPITGAFYHAWLDSSSAANARAFTTWSSVGAEIQYIKKTGEVVSSTALIAGTEANGINVTTSAVTRNVAAGSMTIAAGSAGVLQLGCGSTIGISIGANGVITYPTAATFVSNGAVATTLGSLGPAGSHTTVQGWENFVDSGGQTRYRPFW